MEQKLDFSLPSDKPKGTFGSRLTNLLLLVLILVGLANLTTLLWLPRGRSALPEYRDSFSSEQLRDLANKLSQRNLYDQAAKVWQEYLDQTNLPPVERAKALFQVATCQEKAGQYAEAIESLYRCEMAAKVDDLASQVNSHMKDCFERLGRFSALRYEVMARTSYKATEDSAAKVVAAVGPEKITEADLASAIENAVDTQLAPVTPFMTPSQLQQRRQQMLDEYKSADGRQQFLQSWLAQEVLYRQALDQGMPTQPKVKKVLDDVTRSVLAQHLMNELLASRIHITDSDLQTYYDAHKDRFMEKPKDPNQPSRQKAFDEVREEVLQTLASQKSQEVQKTYIKEMMDKYDVIIHSSAFGSPEEVRDKK